MTRWMRCFSSGRTKAGATRLSVSRAAQYIVGLARITTYYPYLHLLAGVPHFAQKVKGRANEWR